MIQKSVFVTAIFLTVIFQSCKSDGTHEKNILNDSLSVARGETLFTQNCSSCHNFIKNGIGPRLAGVAESMPKDWIINFIKDPRRYSKENMFSEISLMAGFFMLI